MIARIDLPGFEPMSKQHSRGYGKDGHTYRLKSYTEAKDDLALLARQQLTLQGWIEPTTKLCAMRVSYRANKMDVDNAGGFVQDAMQGIAYVRDSQVDLVSFRKRRTGPAGITIIIHTLEPKRKGKHK